MEEKKEYRNSMRSRQMIRQAFMELLNEKTFEKITATDIIKRADINRSTFYAHYPDSRGLMDEVVGDIAQVFQNLLSSIDFSTFFQDPKPILLVVVDFLEENKQLYKMLLRSRMALNVLDKLKEALVQQVLACPNLPVKNLSPAVTELRVRILLSGLIDTYRQWLLGEFQCNMDEAADEVVNIIRLWADEFAETDIPREPTVC